MSQPSRQIFVRHQAVEPDAIAATLGRQEELARLLAGAVIAQPRDIEALVEKLSIVVADDLEGGATLGIRLGPVEIVSAIDAALEEAFGRPSPWPDGAGAREFFLHGLYEEIIQQPSNLFETRMFPDGSKRYLPVNCGTWKACLEALRMRVVEGSLSCLRKHGS
ncbi:MAG: hypothetical protein LDL31_00940 [Prosthecobacter sp.]|nr:hypothetical protein [Prosthecobacter sp.]